MKYRIHVLSRLGLFALLLSILCGLFVPCLSGAQEHPFLRVEAGGHNASVRAVLFTPDAQRLISVGYDKVVRIWDATGRRSEPLQTLRFHIAEGESGQITCAAIHPALDTPQLALGVKEGNLYYVRIVDYARGVVLQNRPCDKNDGVITALKFSSDGAQLAAGSENGTLYVWEGSKREPVFHIKFYKGNLKDKQYYYVNALAFSPDNKQLAVAFAVPEHNSGIVQRFDLHNKREVEANQSVTAVTGLDWVQATGTLAWGNQGGEIYLLDAQKQLSSLPTPRDSISCLAFSQDGRQLISAGGMFRGEQHTAHVWNVDQKQETKSFAGHQATVTALALSHGVAPRAASADFIGHISIWNPNDGTPIATFDGGGAALGKVYWSPDGDALAWGGLEANSPVTQAFSLRNTLPTAPPANPAAWHTYELKHKDAATGKDLTLQLNARDGDTLEVLLNGQVIRSLRPGGDIRCFTFTPAGDILVGAGEQLVIYSHDPTQNGGKPLCKFIGHEGSIRSAAVSPVNPNYLATASTDRTVRLWNLDPQTWQHQGGEVLTSPLLSLFMADDDKWIAWTEAGYYYASASGEKMMGWHLNRGLDQPAEFITSEAFYRKFRSEGVIRQVVSLGDLPRAIAQVNQQNGLQLKAQPDLATELRNAPRLEVATVDAAQSDAGHALWQTSTGKVKLRLKVLNAPADGIDLRVQQQHGASEQKTKSLELGMEAEKPGQRTLPLSLAPGENTIVVAARRKEGDAAFGPPLTVHIVYKPVKEEPLPSLYALSIGVQQFQDNRINNQGVLQYPVSDATEFAAALCSQQGLAYQYVIANTLTNAQATPDAIKSKLSEIKQKAKPGDLVVVFVSSHGLREVQDVNKPGLPKLYFALSQTQLERPKFFDTALSCDALINALDDLDPSVRVLIVLDACHAGPLVDPHAYNDGLTALNRQFYVLASCGANQTSIEDPGLMHGLFTGLLLEALGPNPKRLGDLFQPNTPIPLFQLEFYVKQRIYERLNQLKIAHEQYPTFSGPDGGYFPVMQIR